VKFAFNFQPVVIRLSILLKFGKLVQYHFHSNPRQWSVSTVQYHGWMEASECLNPPPLKCKTVVGAHSGNDLITIGDCLIVVKLICWCIMGLQSWFCD